LGKVISSRSIATPNNVARKTKDRTKKFLCVSAAFLFLGTGGCGHAEAEGNSTPDPDPTATISSTKTTPTPMPADKITPEATSTPEPTPEFQIHIPTEEEEELIKKMALKYYQKTSSVAIGTVKYQQDEESTLEMIRNLRGEFVSLKKYTYTGTNPDAISPTSACYMEMSNFLMDYTGTFLMDIGSILIDGAGEKPDFPVDSEIFSVLDEDKKIYVGLDLLLALEEVYKEMYNTIGTDWEAFKKQAVIYQKFVESFYLNENISIEFNGQKLTSFNNCHPGIKMIIISDIQYQLRLIYIAELSIGEIERDSLEYSPVDLSNKALEDILQGSSLYEEMVQLMDAYTAIIEQGTYDAYMTGSNTRKNIIKQLVLTGKTALY